MNDQMADPPIPSENKTWAIRIPREAFAYVLQRVPINIRQCFRRARESTRPRYPSKFVKYRADLWLEVTTRGWTRQSVRRFRHSAETHCADMHNFWSEKNPLLQFSQERCHGKCCRCHCSAGAPFIHVPTRQGQHRHSKKGDASPLVASVGKIDHAKRQSLASISPSAAQFQGSRQPNEPIHAPIFYRVRST